MRRHSFFLFHSFSTAYATWDKRVATERKELKSRPGKEKKTAWFRRAVRPNDRRFVLCVRKRIRTHAWCTSNIFVSSSSFLQRFYFQTRYRILHLQKYSKLDKERSLHRKSVKIIATAEQISRIDPESNIISYNPIMQQLI